MQNDVPVMCSYWLDLVPTDIHWNFSDPGWAKTAWSMFGPWMNGACIFIHSMSKFDPEYVVRVCVKPLNFAIFNVVYFIVVAIFILVATAANRTLSRMGTACNSAGNFLYPSAQNAERVRVYCQLHYIPYAMSSFEIC